MQIIVFTFVGGSPLHTLIYMLTEGVTYAVELVCRYPQWWRFNLYMTIVSFDDQGNTLSFTNFTDRIYDLETGSGRTAPEGFDPEARVARVESPPCHSIEVYVYAVTNTFPDSDNIKDSPPFDATLNVYADGEAIASENYPVNQWGGLTVAARKFALAGA